MKLKDNSYSQYTAFIDICNKIFDIFIESEVALSPLLSIGKPIPEILNKKQKIIKKVTKEKYYSHILTFIPRILINLLILITHHFYHLYYWQQFSFKKFAKTGIIFLSHYTGQELTSKEDLYFGMLGEQINENKRPNLILHINHGRRNPPNLNLKTDPQKINCEKYILPKTVNTKLLFQLYKINFHNFKEIMNYLLTKGENDKGRKIFMLELAVQQLSLESISQMILAKNIELLIEQTDVNKIILTYEGHSYETYVANKLKSKFPRIDIYVYQFAPVVPAQNSFFRNFYKLHGNVKILVTGSKFKNDIISRSKFNFSSITVMGSRKYGTKEPAFKVRKDVTILFAAEGSRESLIEFINLASYSARQNPATTFIVRAHPASSNYSINLFKKVAFQTRNLFLSCESLKNDLQRATHCVYQSSSVGLEGLRCGVIPIHYAKNSNSDLDPINNEDLPHLQLADLLDFNKKISEISNNYVEITEQQFRDYKEVFKVYFEPLKLNLLNH